VELLGGRPADAGAWHGNKTPHNDGFHISTDAWSVQSFTGLQALDSVWRGLLAAVPTSSVATRP